MESVGKIVTILRQESVRLGAGGLSSVQDVHGLLNGGIFITARP
jgi:hypothetical protein